MGDDTKEKSIYATLGLVVIGLALLAVAIGGIYGTRGTVEHIEDLITCPGEPSERCWTGNACMVTDKRKRCPHENSTTDSHSQHAKGGGWHPKKGCDQYYCSEPVQLADGSCCNENDFCYLPDYKKTCQSGMCVSQNYSLCKGSCVYHGDCNAYPIPLSPNFFGESTSFCNWGTCITIAAVAINPPNPLNLLNSNGSTNRSIVACVEGICNLVGEIGVDELPYECSFMYICSRNNPQVVDPGRKRAFADFHMNRLGEFRKKVMK